MNNPLQEVYDSPGRYYHNWSHIQDCLSKLNEFLRDPLNGDEFGVLSDALVWHDLVYDAQRNDNEIQSAIEYALYSVGNFGRAREVTRLILLTKDHMVEQGDLLGAIMVSIDLSSLGCDPEQFLVNSENLRKEHAHVVDTDWRGRSMAFFEDMLNREVIFPLPLYRERYEEQARINMMNAYLTLRDDL